MNDVKYIPISSIYISENRHWNIYEKDIEKLKSSIKEQGLITPIAVQERNGEYKLIAGEHRLTACKQLGWNEIPAHIIDREYEEDEMEDLRLDILEADENLKRKVPDFVAESFILSRREAAYNKLMDKKFNLGGKTPLEVIKSAGGNKELLPCPETGHGGKLKTFSKDLQESTGISQSVARSKIKLGKLIDNENSKIIKDNKLGAGVTEMIGVGCNSDNKEAFNKHLEIIDKLPNDINKNSFYSNTLTEIKNTLPKKFQAENPKEFVEIVADRIDDYVSLEKKKNETNTKLLKKIDVIKINNLLAKLADAQAVCIVVDGEVIYEF